MDIQDLLKVVKDFIDGIDEKIRIALSGLSFNYYITGKIKTVNGDGTYVVTINEKDDTLKAKDGVTLTVGDIVLIMIPNSNRSHAFIDCKKVY